MQMQDDRHARHRISRKIKNRKSIFFILVSPPKAAIERLSRGCLLDLHALGSHIVGSGRSGRPNLDFAENKKSKVNIFHTRIPPKGSYRVAVERLSRGCLLDLHVLGSHIVGSGRSGRQNLDFAENKKSKVHIFHTRIPPKGSYREAVERLSA